MKNERGIVFYISAEDSLTAKFGFRVTPNGNRKIEFVNRVTSQPIDGKESAIKFIGFATRPATQQECIMWDWLVHMQIQQRMAGVEEEDWLDPQLAPQIVTQGKPPVPEFKNEQQE